MTDQPDSTTVQSSTNASASPEEVYRRLRDRSENEAAGLRRRSAAVGRGRLAVFLGAVLCLAPALVGTPTPRLPWLAAAVVLGALFLGLVAWDARLARHVRRWERLRDVNGRSLSRRDIELSRLAPCPPVAELLGDRSAPSFARDLYLFGHASLFRLASTAHTPEGRRTLARWLLEPAPPDEVARRQDAVRTLAGRLDLRQELEALATGLPASAPDLERFYEWAEGPPWLGPRSPRLWTARVLTLLVPAGVVGVIAGIVPWTLWLVVAMGGYLLSATSAERLHEIFDRATAGGDGLRGYGPLFRALDELLGEGRGAGDGGDLLAELDAALRPAGRSGAPGAADWMDRLERLSVLADARRGLIHFFVQVLTLWDFHVAARLEAWQREAGSRSREWLGSLGTVEALGSLAALGHAHPEWAWPRVEAQAESLSARELGHPLIAPDRRVGNDVRVGPPGSFLLVTGSNMSGKTTLIRAIGVNAVLAQAGGPVCARELAMPPVRLATSIVVEDSLEEGVSFFMAELLRLKSVVEAAREAAEGPAGASSPHGNGRMLLFLLDEVLRGTNSAERRVAIQRVLERLLELPTIGAITTHDLELTRGAAAGTVLARAAVPIHFRETVHPRAEGGAEMSFDYKARPGLAPTTNALRLLAAVGLGGENR